MTVLLAALAELGCCCTEWVAHKDERVAILFARAATPVIALGIKILAVQCFKPCSVRISKWCCHQDDCAIFEDTPTTQLYGCACGEERRQQRRCVTLSFWPSNVEPRKGLPRPRGTTGSESARRVRVEASSSSQSHRETSHSAQTAKVLKQTEEPLRSNLHSHTPSATPPARACAPSFAHAATRAAGRTGRPPIRYPHSHSAHLAHTTFTFRRADHEANFVR